MQKHLEYCKQNRILQVNKDVDLPIGLYAYITINRINISLTYKTSYACTYICRLDTDEVPIQQIEGGLAYKYFKKYVNLPELDWVKDSKLNITARQVTEWNERFKGIWNYAYYYDINSAFPSVMYEEKYWPDTSVMPRSGIVEENEIGFVNYGDYTYIADAGDRADWIFPRCEIPGMKIFAEHFYEKKRKAKDEKEKLKYKQIMNFAIGCLKHHNPFIRVYIIEKCNRKMNKLIEDNKDIFLYANTDAIVTLKPINVKIGTELGEFKYEEGKFAYIGFPYQFNDKISYAGVPNKWFPEGWDITKDDIPFKGNKYRFNYETELIEEIKDEEDYI